MNSCLTQSRPGALTIGEMAAKYGVTLRTLRFYEDRGILTPSRAGNARFYSTQDCLKIQLVIMGKRLGFSLSEIEKLIQAHIALNNAPPAKIQDTLDDDTVAAQLARLKTQRNLLDEAIHDLQSKVSQSDT